MYLFSAIGKQHSVQKLGCPLAVKSPQGKDQDVNSADNLSPSSAISMCIQTDDAIKQASLSCGSCVQPVCSASSQMSDEDCTQPLLLPKGNNPLHKQPFVPSDAPTCATEKEGARSLLQQKTDKAIGPSRSQRIIQLLDLYARDLRQAQSSVIQRVPWGQPISAGANSLKVGQSNYLVWAEKSRMPAIKEQQLAISYSSSQKGLSKTCPKKSTEDDSWVGANRGEKKKLSLRVMVKHASPKAEPPCPLGEDFSHLAGSDLPRRGSCSRRNCVNAGNSSLQHPGLEAIADSDFTEPTESPSHNHLVGSSSVDIDARSHKLPVSAKRLKLCPARRMITDPSKKSNNSTVSSRRLGSQKYSLNSQDADVPDTLQSSSDVSNRQGFERMHTSSNVGRKKRRWITDDDSDEDCTVSNNPPSSYTQVASASMNKQEKETNDGDQEVKANHSE